MTTRAVRDALARLLRAVDVPQPAAVAVSGGVDSMTLAVLAGRTGRDVAMFHALSPAVPPEATARVRRYAEREGWPLVVLDAGEFEDPRYRANPVDRCYYCKTHLYASMAARTERVLWSGTNRDDLGDFRPGLRAAAEHGVRHPYVEAGIGKATVRALAHLHHLDDLSELPAAPCLSSRVQTGIPIDARDLGAIHAVETSVSAALRPRTVRCRVRGTGAVIELDPEALARLGEDEARTLARAAGDAFAGHRPGLAVSFAPYVMGSAFVRPPPAPRPG